MHPLFSIDHVNFRAGIATIIKSYETCALKRHKIMTDTHSTTAILYAFSANLWQIIPVFTDTMSAQRNIL